MDIPIKELKALLQKSGNRCAFSNCGEVLLEEGTDAGDPVVLSKIAHIVAESPDGPSITSRRAKERGQSASPMW